MSEVKKCDIVELKVLAKPPALVKEVLTVVLLLLGYPEQESQDWNVIKKALLDSMFLTKVKECDGSRASLKNMQKAKSMLETLTPEKVKKSAYAAYGLSVWARNIVSQRC